MTLTPLHSQGHVVRPSSRKAAQMQVTEASWACRQLCDSRIYGTILIHRLPLCMTELALVVKRVAIVSDERCCRRLDAISVDLGQQPAARKSSPAISSSPCHYLCASGL